MKITKDLKRYLRPLFPHIGPVGPPAKSDLAEYKKLFGPRGTSSRKRIERRRIQEAFGKPLHELTLEEYREFTLQGFYHKFALKHLWTQLTPPEQKLVLQLNEWAFAFPASFDTETDYLRACAARLKKFFGRTFICCKSPRVSHQNKK